MRLNLEKEIPAVVAQHGGQLASKRIAQILGCRADSLSDAIGRLKAKGKATTWRQGMLTIVKVEP